MSIERLNLTFTGAVRSFAAGPGKVVIEGIRTVDVPFAPPAIILELSGCSSGELRAVTDELGEQLEVTVTVRRAPRG